MPRPGTRVIPTGWSKHHRPVAEATITAECTIRDPSQDVKVWNDDTGENTITPAAPYYTGRCRAQQQKQPQVATTGGQRISNHDYLVAVPAAVTTVRVGHVVTITGSVDESLVGRTLQVTDVQRGSEIWQRDLICIDHLG